MIGSPVQDSVSGHWSYARQGVELSRGCGVQVQLRRRAGTAAARRARASAARRPGFFPTIAHFTTWITADPDQDLLTVYDDLGKVEITRFRRAAEASSGIDGIRDSGAVGKLHQAWPADRAQDV
ncbi:MAG: hypothetical protein K0S98_1924, partial [Propionibacteriaceae bacterium]|nr:hypothetical protein [Propionibacteriaceae bacterium]